MPTWLARKSTARPRCWWLLPCALALVWLLQSAPAQAQDGPHRIRVILVGRIAEDPSFGDRVKSWFDATRFDVVVETQSHLDANHVLLPNGNAELHVFFVVAKGELARLYFARISPDSGHVTYLLRDVELSTGLDELGKERMAQVATLSAAALLDGQAQSPRNQIEATLRDSADGSTPRQPVSKPKPSTAPPPTQKKADNPRSGQSSLRWGGGLGYGLSPRGDEGLWHGPRGTLELRSQGLEFGLLLQGFLPVRRNLDGVTLRTLGLSAGLGVGWYGELHRTLGVSAMLGPGFDLVAYGSDSSQAGQTAGQSATELRPALGVMGYLESKRFPLRLLLGASLALLRTHYDAVGPDAEREVLGRAPTLAVLGGLEFYL